MVFQLLQELLLKGHVVIAYHQRAVYVRAVPAEGHHVREIGLQRVAAAAAAVADAYLLQAVEDVLLQLCEQVVHIAVVRVEGAAVHVGQLGYLAHGYVARAALHHQGGERHAELLLCLSDPAVSFGLFHLKPP